MAINTLITVKDALDQFVANHKQLKRIVWEAEDHRAPVITESDEFPVIFACPIDVKIGVNMNTHTIRLYVYERINDDRSDVLENANDTSLYLRDVVVWWNSYGDDEIQIISDPLASFISDAELDNLVGYYSDLMFEIPSHGRCEVPIIGIPPIGSFCAPATAVNSDGSFSLSIPSGGTATIPDTTYNFIFDGQTYSTTLPTGADHTINIILT